jgi:hypothetical protein
MGSVMPSAEHLSGQEFLDPRKEMSRVRRNATTNDDEVGVNGVHQIADSQGNPPGELLENLECIAVTLIGSPGDMFTQNR